MMQNPRKSQQNPDGQQYQIEHLPKLNLKISSAVAILTSGFLGISALASNHLLPEQNNHRLQPLESLKAQTNPSPEATPPNGEGNIEVLVAEVVIKGTDEPQLIEEIDKILYTKAGKTSTRQKLQEDINNIFALGWFRNVTAIPEDTPLGVRVTFQVEVNPVLRSVNVTGTQVLKPQIVEQIFKEQFNQRINFRQIEAGIQKINAWYQENGYAIAQVISAPDVSADGVVTLSFAEGIIEDIKIEFIDNNNQVTSPATSIQNLDQQSPFKSPIHLKIGEIFNQNLATAELQRLFGMGGLTDVKLSINPGVNDPRSAILVYQIQPQTTSESLEQEAEKLAKENTPEARQKAIEKYEQAAQFYAEKGDRVRQAKMLRKIADLEAQSVDQLIGESNNLNTTPLVSGKTALNGDNRLNLESSSSLGSLLQTQNIAATTASKSATLLQLPTPANVEPDLLGLSTLIPPPPPDPNTEKIIKTETQKVEKQQKTLNYLNESSKIFREVEDHWGEVLQIYHMGYLHRKWQEPEQALQYFNQALDRLKPLSESQAYWLEVAILNEMGLASEELKNYSLALETFKKLLSKLQQLQVKKIEMPKGEVSYQLAVQGLKKNEPEMVGSLSLSFSHEWRQEIDPKQAEEHQKVEAIILGSTLIKIGQAYQKLDNQPAKIAAFQESLEILKQQLKALKEADDPLWLFAFLALATINALGLDDPQQSLTQIREIVAINQEINLPEVGSSLLLLWAGLQTYRPVEPEQLLPALEEASTLIQQVKKPEWKASLEIVSAWLYLMLEQPEKTKSLLEQVPASLEQVKQLELSIPLRLGWAGVYQKLGERQKSLTILSGISSEINDLKKPEMSSSLLMGLAWLYEQLDERKLALETLTQAINKIKQVQNVELVIALSLGSSWLSSELGNLQLASATAEQAFSQINQLQNPLVKVALLTGWAWVMENNFDEQQTLTALRQAFQKLRNQVNPSQQLNEMQLIVFVPEILVMLKQPKLAIAFYEQIALYHKEQLNDSTKSTQFFEKIPDTYRRIGQPKLAIENYQTVANDYRQSGQIQEATRTLLKLGQSYQDIGEYQQAIQSFNEAGKLLENSEYKQETPVIYQELGRFYGSLGDPQQAQFYYKRAQDLATQQGNSAQIVDILEDLGDWYRRWGEADQALEAYQQALQQLTQLSQSNQLLLPQWQETLQAALSRGEWMKLQALIRNTQPQAVIQAKISLAYSDLGKKPEAIAAFQNAVTLAQSADIEVKRQMFIQGAILYEALEEPEQAIYFLKQAQVDSNAFLSTLDDSPQQAAILTFLGKLNAQMGNTQAALTDYNEALKLAKDMGNPALEADALYRIAEVERKANNISAALTKLETALEIVEGLRTEIGDLSLRASYFATVQDYYDLYIDLLMQLHQTNPNQGYDVQALHASERAKARTLLELLALANADIRQGVDSQLLAREQTLQRQFQSLEEHRLHLFSENAPPEQIQALEQRQQELLQQYRELRTQLQATPNRYANLTQPQPLTLKEIQEQVLDDQTILLQYALGKEQSYVWAVTKNSMTSYQLPGRKEIETLGKDMIRALTSPRERIRLNTLATVGNQLTALILNPVASQLENKRLLVVGDGILHYIPFSALPIPQASPSEEYQPLILQHEVVNLPSASTLAVLRQETATRPRPSKTVAILADPVFSPDDDRVNAKNSSQLEEGMVEAVQTVTRAAGDLGVSWDRLTATRREAEAIMGLVSETQRSQALDFQANREMATSSQLSQYQIIHWATHGFVNSRNPELSGIVMSLVDQQGNWQNGYLRLNDIYNLNLPSELVVLSACQTALGKNIRGEGLVGLTRGFMYAGTPRVVASLWYVDDVATAELMTKFYQAMLSQGLTPSAALRAAQLEMWNNEEWRSPYFWAAFTLQGEWRPSGNR